MFFLRPRQPTYPLNNTGQQKKDYLGQIIRDVSAVLLSEIQLPGMSGLELQEEIARRELFVPMVVVTAFAKLKLVVKVVKKGAIAIVPKPVDNEELWLGVREALTTYRNGYVMHNESRVARGQLAELTSNELRVLNLMLAGTPNKTIARRLDVSVRTVEARRRRLIDKFEVDSAMALCRKLALLCPESAMDLQRIA